MENREVVLNESLSAVNSLTDTANSSSVAN